MSFKCSNYTNREKYQVYNRRSKAHYRVATGSYLYGKRPWEQNEIDLLFKGGMTDRELSVKIERSLTAIQIKRSKLRKLGYTA